MLWFHLPPRLKVPHSVTLFSILRWKLEIVGAETMEWRQFFPASVVHQFPNYTGLLGSIRFFRCHAVVSSGSSRWRSSLTQRRYGHCLQSLGPIVLVLEFRLMTWQRKHRTIFCLYKSTYTNDH